MEQQGLFDATEARDSAIATAAAGAGDAWLAAAVQRIGTVAATKLSFTTDDVWATLEAVGLRPREPRALGAAMKLAAKQGTIVATDMYRPSSRVECHARPVRVWRAA
jgi:threonine dehydrogenase-like Zn-dependent dehydrogenase